TRTGARRRHDAAGHRSHRGVGAGRRRVVRIPHHRRAPCGPTVRRDPATPDERRWDPEAPEPGLLDGVDAVVHLAGAPIAGRFTDSHKAAIRDSRVGPTRRLAEAAARADDGPDVFVSASAIGYYGHDRPGEVLREGAESGADFLAGVVRDWEDAACSASMAGQRTGQERTGNVEGRY